MCLSRKDDDAVAAICADRGYSTVKTIGEGSFGTATLVRNRNGGLYVMKSMNISRFNKSEKNAAAAEVTVLSSLKHPYIVRYQESIFDNHTLAIVMDYADGGDLSKKINATRFAGKHFPESQILRWFTQMILGLKYIHGLDILHRDLKPQNLFLTKHEQLRIGDFGISKVLHGASARKEIRETAQMGTPFYMSPEIVESSLYSCSSDIWAAGCVLYELCALQVPFEAANLLAFLRAIATKPVPAFPHIYSLPLRQLGARILVREHTQRPTAAEIIQSALLQGEMSRMLQDEKATHETSTSPALARNSDRPQTTALTGGRESLRQATLQTQGQTLAPLSTTRLPSKGLDRVPGTPPRGDVLRQSVSAALLLGVRGGGGHDADITSALDASSARTKARVSSVGAICHVEGLGCTGRRGSPSRRSSCRRPAAALGRRLLGQSECAAVAAK
jgi:NIMA (never in mitosis gene a)-related kinase